MGVYRPLNQELKWNLNGDIPRLFGPAIAASILSCMAGDNK
jgi:hypothetical protein